MSTKANVRFVIWRSDGIRRSIATAAVEVALVAAHRRGAIACGLVFWPGLLADGQLSHGRPAVAVGNDRVRHSVAERIAVAVFLSGFGNRRTIVAASST
jgi:hypothetical protein